MDRTARSSPIVHKIPTAHRARKLVVAVIAVASLVVVSLAAPAFAHHGWSDYDGDKPITLKGRIRNSSYENPHATITLAVDGKIYEVILAPVSRMEARGASREAVAVGKDVTVVGYPSRSHADEIRAERIVVADGTVEKSVELR